MKIMCRKLSEKIILPQEVQDKIIKALQNSSFIWRSAESIACELNYDYNQVYNYLYYHDNVIFNGKMNRRGELLFAWRDKYWKEIPIKTRIINAITNTIN